MFTQFRDLHKGKIKWFNEDKGFGFITRVSEEGDDVFLQLNGVTESEKFRPLFEGDVIEYDIEEKSKGPVAKNVQVLTRAPRSDNGERVQPSEQDKKRAQEYVEFSRHSSQGSQSL
jgi:CspA family cold shock protein